MEYADTSLLAEYLGIDPTLSENSSSNSVSEFHAILNENSSSQDHNSGESLINNMFNAEINSVNDVPNFDIDDNEYYNDVLLPNSCNEEIASVDRLNTHPNEPLNPTCVLTESSTPIVHVNDVNVNSDNSMELQQNQNPNNMMQPLYTQNQTSEINSTYLPKTADYDNIGTALLSSNEGKYVITSPDQVKYVITVSDNAEIGQLLMPTAVTISNSETTALNPPSVNLAVAGPSSSYDQEMPSPTSSNISYEVSTPLSVSSVHNGSESTSKKKKKYEEEPYLDPIKEKERLNAIKAKNHRDGQKRKLDVLEKENKKIKGEAEQYKNKFTFVSKELQKEREENVKLKAKIQEYEQLFSQFRKQGQLLYQENINMSDFVNYNG